MRNHLTKPATIVGVIAVLAALLIGVTTQRRSDAAACPDIRFLGNYPSDVDLDWSENVQGVAHDDTYWFVTNIDTLNRIPLGADLAEDPDWELGTNWVHLPSGYNHFGDLDQYGGYLFVPLAGEGRSAIAAYGPDLTLHGIVDTTLYQDDQNGWLAVNPVNGDLYTSGQDVSASEPMHQYHLDLAGLQSTGSLAGNLTHLGIQSLHEDGGLLKHRLGSMQGGAFTPWGDLFISNGYFDDSASHYRGGIHLFGADFNLITESTNGYGDFNYEYHPGYLTGHEPEGIDWFPNAQTSGSPGVAGELHALLLNNDQPDGDNLWFKHYSVDFSCRPNVPPTVVGTPDRAPNGVGWYDAPVVIDWHAPDDSGAASDPPDTVAGTEGQSVNYVSDRSCDAAGSCATGTINVSLDLTNPVVQCQPATFQLHQPSASVSATVSDLVSGPVQAAVSAPADTSAVGTGSVQLTGTDHAGRQSTVSCPYSVAYRFEGFLTPVANPPTSNRVNAGQAVPVKWRVTDFNGAPVDSASFGQMTSRAFSCSTGDPTGSAEPVTSSPGLRYLGDGTWQFSWHTSKAYAGQCRTLTLTLSDGSTHTANFEFR